VGYGAVFSSQGDATKTLESKQLLDVSGKREESKSLIIVFEQRREV